MPKDKYSAPSGEKIMGHDKQPKACDALAAQKKDIGRIDPRKMDLRGTPEKAFEYKY